MSAVQRDAARGIADCWNRIGVRGDATCRELERHVHCRNCPVHSAAATELLGVDCSAEQLLEHTRRVSEPRVHEDLSGHSLLLFRVGVEWLALPTSALKEVARERPIHSVPHRRGGGVRGLTNIRGELLVCINLERMLDAAASPTDLASAKGSGVGRLVVLDDGGKRVACSVDEVLGVQRFAAHELKDRPTAAARVRKSYLRATVSWNDRTIGVLDESRLFKSIREALPSVRRS